MRLVSLVLAVSTVCQAAFLNSPSDALKKQYDFIVVGSGPAGATIANRLSENPAWNVLLVEAGPIDTSDFNIAVPGLVTHLLYSAVDWNYTSIPLPSLNNRTIGYNRGKVLGGSSSINFMLENKGSTEWWDTFASEVGDPSLAYNTISQTYLKKFEKWVNPVATYNTTGEFVSNIHGTSGPVEVDLANYVLPIQNLAIESYGQIPGYEYNEETNDGNMLGLSNAQQNQGGGVRWNSALSYVRNNNYYQRPNFDILTNTLVTQLVFAPAPPVTSHYVPAISGVKVQQSSTAPSYTIHVRKEVIVSGGAINTPQLLLLSGIGDPSQLSHFNIPTIVNSPNVGKNLQDHPFGALNYEVNASTYDDLSRNTTLLDEAIQEWNQTKSGPLSSTFCAVWAWTRINETDPIFKEFKDPYPKGNSPHAELLVCNGWFSPVFLPLPSTGHFISAAYAGISPLARGNITLQSASPWVEPLINPAFLTNDFDLALMRFLFKQARAYVETSAPLKDVVIGLSPANDADGVETDDEIDAYHRNAIGTIWHPTSTAAMGKNGTTDGVVNTVYQVKGVANLRVVDASVFPSVTSGHPTGQIYAMGERAADLIKAYYGYPV